MAKEHRKRRVPKKTTVPDRDVFLYVFEETQVVTKHCYYCCLLELPVDKLVRRLTNLKEGVVPNTSLLGGSFFGLADPCGSNYYTAIFTVLFSKLLSVPPEHELSVVRLKKVAIQLTGQGLQVQKYSAAANPRSVCQSFKSSQNTLRFVRYPRVVHLRLLLPCKQRSFIRSTVTTNISVPRLSSLRLLHGLFRHPSFGSKAKVSSFILLCPGAVFAVQQRMEKTPRPL